VKKLKKTFLIICSLSIAFGSLSGFWVYWYFSRDLPRIISMEDYRPALTTEIIAYENLPDRFREEPLEAESVGEEGENLQVHSLERREKVVGEFFVERRYLMSYEEIPKIVIQAFIAAEDAQFFEHDGISPTAILRAAIANFRAGYVVQGGSTITQQVAKSLFLTPDRNMVRKIKEAILAYRLERNLNKEEILYLYLNQIYLGHGAHGIKAAARAYFDKEPEEITLPEAALLAALPRAPSRFNPFSNPSRAKQRQIYTLSRMVENEFITREQMREAAALPLRLYRRKNINQEYAPYYVEHVRRHLQAQYGDALLYQGGLRVYLPTSASLLKSSTASVMRGVEELDKRRGYRGHLGRVEDGEAYDEYLETYREELIQRRIPFDTFMPDATISRVEGLRLEKIERDQDLIQVGEKYEAVVRQVSDQDQQAFVQIATIKARLPHDNLKWASAFNPDARNSRAPDRPSQVVRRGDRILVKVEEITADEVIVSLEQEPDAQAALFSIEVDTGYVLAMVGGYDFSKSEFNRAIQAERQPGSSFKPMIYSLALENGYTPASVILDSPIVFEDEEIGSWKPTNFGRRFYGDTTFRQALILSRNIPTIKIVQDLGVQSVIEYARKLGMKGHFNNDLSISLGSGSTNLMELAQAYTVYPRLGRRVEPVFIKKILNREGDVIEDHPPQRLPDYEDFLSFHFEDETESSDFPEGRNFENLLGTLEDARENRDIKKEVLAEAIEKNPDQLLDPRAAYLMTHLLREAVEEGTGRRARGLRRSAAGKTGTTNDYHDAWFVGFTPDVVSAVWVGFDEARSLGFNETGGRTALPIWLSYMQDAVKSYDDRDFLVPPGVLFTTIDSKTGKLADPDHSRARLEAFIHGTEPKEFVGDDGEETIDSEADFFKEDFE
jgi:penicillin-binding protein 1A